MTIQDQLDAMYRGDFHLVLNGETWSTRYAQLTRLLALVNAAEEMLSGEMSSPYPSELSGVEKALADLRKHGDIPAETGT